MYLLPAAADVTGVEIEGKKSQGNCDEHQSLLALQEEEGETQEGNLAAYRAAQVLGANRKRVLTRIITLGAPGNAVLSIAYLNHAVSNDRWVVIEIPDCRRYVIDDNVTNFNLFRVLVLNQDEVAGMEFRLHAGAENRHKRHGAPYRHEGDEA